MGKTKPFTIRFDEDKLAFVKQERNLEKEQSVVDFLLEHYYWVKKLAGDGIPNKIVLQENFIKNADGTNTPLKSVLSTISDVSSMENVEVGQTPTKVFKEPLLPSEVENYVHDKRFDSPLIMLKGKIPEDKLQEIVDRDSLLAQIEAIKAEKIPPERNTALGRKVWQAEQDKRILELQNKLK